MSKCKKLMSVFAAAVLAISMLSCFCVTSAATTDVDKLIYSPFTALSSNPGYGSAAPSGVIFVASGWKNIEDGKWVYMDYDGAVYKAVKGINAFATITDALDISGSSNMKIKVGAGTYQEDIILTYSGVKFYGNYAGVCPNVPGSKPYIMDLNPERNPELESVIHQSEWKWTTTSNNITIDGFKVTALTSSKRFLIAVSGAYSEYFYFYNNIMTTSSGTAIDANRGYSTGTYMKYNRFTNNTGTIFMGGGSMSDTVMDNNYFESNSGSLYQFTSCGANGNETLVSFSNNVVNNCAGGVNFNYDNSNFGANLDYKRIVGNVFNNSGSGAGFVIRANYVLEYMKNSGDATPTLCNDGGCKTFISQNEFYNTPSGISAIKLDGGGNLTGRTVNFIVSATQNKFLYKSSASGRLAIYSTLIGTLDASHNFFGTITDSGDIVKFNPSEDNFDINNDTRIIYMPYYNDFEMTTLSGGISLEVGSSRILKPNGFDKQEFIIDNEEAVITARAIDGFETVNFTNVITGADYEIYKDFLLTDKAGDKKVDILDDITRAYLVATDSMTGMNVRYDVIIKSNTDKTKAEIRKVIDLTTMSELEYYSMSGTDITIELPSKYIYFPFDVVSSPSAACTLYTDEAMTAVYDNPTGYIKPDEDIVLYAKIVSGDKSNTSVYNIKINRPGSNDYDSRIISVVSPEQDTLIFNNERKSVSYRPFSMISSAKFEFFVSTNATYSVYSSDKETGDIAELLYSQNDIKEIPIGDGINYFYVKVVSSFGYAQKYKLVVYNDVKSDDNVITGITGMTNVPIDENNVIHLDVSTTLSAVNTHFETNAFADVVVFADEDRTFALTPSFTYVTVNNRQVERRVFRLGITSQIAYYYVNVTSETGKLNQYKVIISKGSTEADFIDMDNHWSKDYANEVARLGIVKGYYDEESFTYTFAPNQNATRQEIAVILCRMMGIDQLSFKDVSLSGVYSDSDSIAEWSYNYVKATYSLGVMKGKTNEKGDTVFSPAENISRQEFFQAISNMLKLDTAAAANVDLSAFKDVSDIGGWAVAATKAVVKAGIVSGDNDGYLKPRDNITRGEIAKIASIVNTISQDVE